jgi:hypothetical protein
VPDVVGLAQADAIAALELAGFAVQVVQQSSSTVAVGVVISQAPPAGSMSTEGATVTITVSSGDTPRVDPTLHGKKRKQHKNLTFKPAREEDEAKPSDEPAKAAKPKARASGLLLGLLKRTQELPPAEPVAVVVAPALPDPPAEVATPTPEPVPAAPPPVDPLEELEQRLMARIESAAAALDAKLDKVIALVSESTGRIEHDLALTLPMDSPRDPLNEALMAILPSAREPSTNPPQDPAPDPDTAKAVDLKAENARRARILAERLL